MAGTFGYELDLAKLTEDEKDEIQQQIAIFQEFYDLIQYGNYYRLLPPESGCSVWECASPDGSEALISAVYNHVESNMAVPHVKVLGLLDDAFYYAQSCGTAAELLSGFPDLREDVPISGAALKRGGLPIPPAWRNYQNWQIHITRCKE